jgi:hypothetical protein
MGLAPLLVTGFPLEQGIEAKSTRARSVVEATACHYPFLAGIEGIEGTVTIEAIIRGDGTVETARAIGGPKLLHAVAERCASKWRFASSTGTRGEKVALQFVFRLMPDGTVQEDLTPIFVPPYKVIVRGTKPKYVTQVSI